MRVKDVLRSSSEALKRARARRPLREAEWILCHVLQRDRIHLYLEADRLLVEEENRGVEQMLIKRLQGQPIQYIMGRVGFYTGELKADSRALIPRPDTETLIDVVLDLGGQGMTFRRIVDVGTGSGNIAITLARHFPGTMLCATDISEEAISLARENADLNDVEGKIRFIVADLLAPFNSDSVDLIVSNPPYVSDSEWASLSCESRYYEPSIALRGGPEGLDTIRPMVKTAFDVLSEGGAIIFEFGHMQWNSVRILLADAGYQSVELHRDINGKPRVAVAFK